MANKPCPPDKVINPKTGRCIKIKQDQLAKVQGELDDKIKLVKRLEHELQQKDNTDEANRQEIRELHKGLDVIRLLVEKQVDKQEQLEKEKEYYQTAAGFALGTIQDMSKKLTAKEAQLKHTLNGLKELKGRVKNCDQVQKGYKEAVVLVATLKKQVKGKEAQLKHSINGIRDFKKRLEAGDKKFGHCMNSMREFKQRVETVKQECKERVERVKKLKPLRLTRKPKQ